MRLINIVEHTLEEIDYYYRHKIKYPIWDAVIGIKNIIRWMPIIYRDRDYDANFLYKIIVYKMDRLRDQLINGHLIHTKKDLRKLSIGLEAMRRLVNYEYVDYLEDKMDEKWGKVEMGHDENGDFYIRRSKVRTDKDKIESRKDIKAIMDHESYMIDQDLRLFGQSIRHSRKWWD